MRKFISSCNELTPYVVISRDTYFDKPALEEGWQTKEQAMLCGKVRHKQGYCVQVFKEIAFSRG